MTEKEHTHSHTEVLGPPPKKSFFLSHKSDLLQCHSNASNLVLVGASLKTRKDGAVDLLVKVVHDLLARFAVDAFDAFTVKYNARPETGIKNPEPCTSVTELCTCQQSSKH